MGYYSGLAISCLHVFNFGRAYQWASGFYHITSTIKVGCALLKHLSISKPTVLVPCSQAFEGCCLISLKNQVSYNSSKGERRHGSVKTFLSSSLHLHYLCLYLLSSDALTSGSINLPRVVIKNMASSLRKIFLLALA